LRFSQGIFRHINCFKDTFVWSQLCTPADPPAKFGWLDREVRVYKLDRKFFRNCLGGLPFVIQPDISSEIAFESDNDCETELPGKLKLSTSGVGNFSSADSTTSSSPLLELAE
jgi:hypothetical protein